MGEKKREGDRGRERELERERERENTCRYTVDLYDSEYIQLRVLMSEQYNFSTIHACNDAIQIFS